jgi:type IV secretion system protein VirB4
MRCYRYRGPDLSVASNAEIASVADRLNGAFMRLGSGWTLFIEDARRDARQYPDAQFPSVAARIADMEARSLFESSGLVHDSQYYISLVWMPPADSVSALTNIFFETEGGEPRGTEYEEAYFKRVCTETADLIASAMRECVPLEGEDLLTYLHSTVSTQQHRVAMPDVAANLDAYLPDEAWTPGEISMLGEHCIAMFELRGLPPATPLAMLEELNHVGAHRWVTRHISLDRDEAEQRLSNRQKLWFQNRKSMSKLAQETATKSESPLLNPIAEDRSKEAEAALRLLGSGQAGFGYFTSTLIFWDRDPEIARRKANEAKKIVQNAGIVALDATLNGLEAWLATIPGHLHANVRRVPISSQNLVRLMPSLSVWSGQPHSNHLASVCGVGTPLIRGVAGSTPFDFTPGVDDVLSMFVAGPPGSGKSTLAATIALFMTRYPGAKVILYDIGRSSRAVTMAVGGKFFEIGAPSGALQPLRRIDDDLDRQWATQWVRTLLELQHVTYDHRVQVFADQALKRLAEEELKARTLSRYSSILSTWSSELGEALRPYTLDGPYGHIFDATNDCLDAETPWRVYELGRLLTPESGSVDPALAVPVLMYLSHADFRAFDGRLVFKGVDEAWRFMDHPVAVEQLRAEAKLLRRKNVCLALFTQELADAASKPALFSTCLNALHTHLYLPDPSATTPTSARLYESVGLTPAEIAALASAVPKQDIFYRSPLGRRWFSLPIGPAALAFVGASRETDQHAMDEIERTCRPEEYAAALLERRGVTWAADIARGQAS